MHPSRLELVVHLAGLDRLPLCATAICPSAQSVTIGWALARLLSPAVGVAHVPHRHVPGEAATGWARRTASVTWPIAARRARLGAVRHHDARALLTSVLLRVEAEVRQARGLRMAEDPEHSRTRL